MHVVILILERVVVRAGPQIALFVEVKLLLVRGKSPHSDVKLSPLEQQRSLDVLLNDPIGVELA
jgi:hypothetical protein